MLIVSGSIGFRGLFEITAGNVRIGLEQFIQMFVVAITVGIGLFIGDTIVRQKGSL